MKLVLVDENKVGGEWHAVELDISPSSTLKALFTEYARRRGASLRALRFSYGGRPLFLSQVAKKTPGQLGMQDRDVVAVQDKSAPDAVQGKEGVDPSPKKDVASSSRHSKARRGANPSKREKKKGEGKKQPKRREEPIEHGETLEQLKIEHSKLLSKIHDELQPQLKKTRQRLNNLLMERSRPKARRGFPKGASSREEERVETPCAQSPEGKAGRSRFVFQVGEVEHLHKTRKPSSRDPGADTPSLDLHGCTRDEALARLDESLGSWIEIAMRGSYPFVIEAVIVCGCGSQVLHDAVKGWIRETRHVANAPRRR